MILVREVFQVKFGHMDPIMAILKEVEESGVGSGMATTVLTDASGQMFTLVFQTKAESMDAYMNRMRASFGDPRVAETMGKMMQHVESGRREFYTIEREA